MKKLILIISFIFMVGCNEGVSKPNFDNNGFRWLIEGEVVQIDTFSSSTSIIEFNNIYGKKYKIISYDSKSRILCVEKR